MGGVGSRLFDMRIDPVIIGFTGTRFGMTAPQLQTLTELIADLATRHPRIEGWHGDCRGADSQFNRIMRTLNLKTVAHPPMDERYRAFTPATEIRDPKPYLVRDRVIVEGCELLLAAPLRPVEPDSTRGSGTWTTVGYARELGRRVGVVWPQGKVSWEPAREAA